MVGRGDNKSVWIFEKMTVDIPKVTTLYRKPFISNSFVQVESPYKLVVIID